MLHATPPRPAALPKVVLAASIGNFVEWFDFAIYGFLATVVAQQFFPGEDAQLSLLKTFAVFAVAFAFRPLGGVVFGMLGDRIGRKRTLALTILLMSGATSLIGLLPNYATIGFLAPLLLTLARCAQGFSAGGEYAGACAYVMEYAPPGRRARYGSFLPVSTFFAFASAALVAFVLERLLEAPAMAEWGWRIPFLAAAPMGLVGLYMRQRLTETPAFQMLEPADQEVHAPLREALALHGRSIACLSAFISLTALSFYTFTTYLATHLQLAGGMERAEALQAMVCALVLAMALCPLAGYVIDGLGRRRSILGVGIFVIVSAYPSFLLVQSGHTAWAMLGLALQAVGAVFSGVLTVPLLSENFPTRIRYTASSISYNLAYTVFGGTAPLMAAYLVGVSHNPVMPAFWLMAVALFALVGGLRLPETAHVSLDQVGGSVLGQSKTAEGLANF